MHVSPRWRRLLTKTGEIHSRGYVKFFTGNIAEPHGFENFEKIDPTRGVLLVVNHRSFYDQFVVTAELMRRHGLRHHIYFPVRANYFYDNPTGGFVNLLLAASTMYPPIVRDRSRRQWNRVATDIMIDLLKQPGNMVGFHPEGTRNRNPDPYEFLPPKPGAGELVYNANPNVLPVFLQGFPDNFGKLCRHNFKHRNPKKPLVHMVMGAPLDFSEERKLEASKKTYLQISQKIMHSINALAEEERKIRESIAG